MKITSVTADQRKREFRIQTATGQRLAYPFSQAGMEPARGTTFSELYVDPELGEEAFTYALDTGEEGSVHIEQVLEFNRDPSYMADLVTYKLTLAAREGLGESGLSRRYIAKRLNTSVPQLYRLLDPTNSRKSMAQLLALLHLLNREVEVVIRPLVAEGAGDSNSSSS